MVIAAKSPGGPQDPHIEMRAVTKSFGAVQALCDVSLTISRGSIHALVGENGAGKSTCAKIIAGVHQPDNGTLVVDGRAVRYRSARDALADKITMIAQELPLVGSMSVLDNVFLGVESRWAGLVDRAAQRKRLSEVEQAFGLRLAPAARVAALSMADRQKVVILQALMRRAELIVMDEPTAALSASDAHRLLRMARRMSDLGTTVVLVSHALRSVLEISDVITVMKDGGVVRTRSRRHETQASLTEAMLGRPLAAQFPVKRFQPTLKQDVISLHGLTSPPAFTDVSFKIAGGEIVGLAGLLGSGRSELAQALAGTRRVASGTVHVAGRRIQAGSPRAALKAGIFLIPADRVTSGLLAERSIAENVTLARLRAVSRCGMLRARTERRLAEDVTARCEITASVSRPVATLSGGNQQRVLLAKALMTKPSILVADEPTRGVDVGAKRAIYELLSWLARQGTGILLISDDPEELIGLADRILIMRMGRIAGEMAGTQASADVLTSAILGDDPPGEADRQ